MKNRIIQSVLFLICGSLLLSACEEKQGQRRENLSMEYVYTVHPQFRMWNTPCADMPVTFNPPVLRWVTDPAGDYSVRLSRSETFDSDETIVAEGLKWAFFKPDRELEKGMWYWQVKSDDGEWSASDRFIVDDTAESFLSPSAAEAVALIPRDRPRVMAWKSELADLRRRASGTREMAAIVSEANVFINEQPPVEKNAKHSGSKDLADFKKDKLGKDSSQDVGDRVRIAIERLSQAYLLTGDEKYIAPAKRWALTVAEYDPAGPTRKSDFGDSGCMLATACAYDTFYDYFTPEEREKLRESTAARMAHFYKSWSNKLDSKVLSGHVWQHIMHRFVLSALSMIGEMPEANEWFSYAYECFIARAPTLGGNDGAWSNGVSYYNMNGETLLDVSELFRDITGVNFLRSPFYANNPIWLTYAFPAGSHTDGMCNDSRKWPMPGLEVIGYADALARITQNPYAAWYADRCAQAAGVEISDNVNYRWLRLHRGMKYPRPEYDADTIRLLPGKTFPDVGLAYMNTALTNTPENIMVAMRSGLFGGYGHMHADHNNFNILTGGEYLFSNSGYRISMKDPHYLGWFKSTVGHNAVLIDGKGQPHTSNGWGWIPRSIYTDQFQYAEGDASMAYDDHWDSEQKKTSGMKYFRRHLSLLPPNIVLVYDVLEAEKPVEWSWLLHSNNRIDQTSENSWKTSNANSTGEVSLFTSIPVETFVTDTFEVKVVNWRQRLSRNTYPDQWHFRASNSQKSTSMRILAVIQMEDTAGRSEILPVETGDVERVVRVGEWEIRAGMGSEPEGILEIRKTDGSLVFTSRGQKTELAGKSYGENPDVARLLLKKGDEVEVIEISDQIPPALYEAMYKQQQPLVDVQ